MGGRTKSGSVSPPFAPLPPPVTRIPAVDLDELSPRVSSSTAAINSNHGGLGGGRNGGQTGSSGTPKLQPSRHYTADADLGSSHAFQTRKRQRSTSIPRQHHHHYHRNTQRQHSLDTSDVRHSLAGDDNNNSSNEVRRIRKASRGVEVRKGTSSIPPSAKGTPVLAARSNPAPKQKKERSVSDKASHARRETGSSSSGSSSSSERSGSRSSSGGVGDDDDDDDNNGNEQLAGNQVKRESSLSSEDGRRRRKKERVRESAASASGMKDSNEVNSSSSGRLRYQRSPRLSYRTQQAKRDRTRDGSAESSSSDDFSNASSEPEKKEKVDKSNAVSSQRKGSETVVNRDVKGASAAKRIEQNNDEASSPSQQQQQPPRKLKLTPQSLSSIPVSTAFERFSPVAFQTLQNVLRRTSLSELKDREIVEWLQEAVQWIDYYDSTKNTDSDSNRRASRGEETRTLRFSRHGSTSLDDLHGRHSTPPIQSPPLAPMSGPAGSSSVTSASISQPPPGYAAELRFLILAVLHTMPWWRFVDVPSTLSKQAASSQKSHRDGAHQSSSAMSLASSKALMKSQKRVLFAFEMLCLKLIQSSYHAVRGVLEILMHPFHVRPPVRDGALRLVPLDCILRILNSICMLYPNLVLSLIEQCLTSLVPKRRWRNGHHHQSAIRALLFLALEAEVPSYESSWQNHYNNPYGKLALTVRDFAMPEGESTRTSLSLSDFGGDVTREGSVCEGQSSTRSSISLNSLVLPIAPSMSDAEGKNGRLSDQSVWSECGHVSSTSASAAGPSNNSRGVTTAACSASESRMNSETEEGNLSSSNTNASGNSAKVGANGDVLDSGDKLRAPHHNSSGKQHQSISKSKQTLLPSLTQYYTSDAASTKDLLLLPRDYDSAFSTRFDDQIGSPTCARPGAARAAPQPGSFAAFAHQQQQNMSLNNKMLAYRNELIHFIMQKLAEMEVTLERAPQALKLGVTLNEAAAAPPSPLTLYASTRSDPWDVVITEEQAIRISIGTLRREQTSLSPTSANTPRNSEQFAGDVSRTGSTGNTSKAPAPLFPPALTSEMRVSAKAMERLFASVSRFDTNFAGILSDSVRITYNCLSQDWLTQLQAGVCGNTEWWLELLQFHFDVVIKMEQPLILLYLAPSLALLGDGEEAVDLMHKLISLVTKGVQPVQQRRYIGSGGLGGAGGGGIGRRAGPGSGAPMGAGGVSAGVPGVGGRMMMPPPSLARGGGGVSLVSMDVRIRAAKHIFPLYKFLSEKIGTGESTRRRLLKWIAQELRGFVALSRSTSGAGTGPAAAGPNAPATTAVLHSQHKRAAQPTNEPNLLVQVVFAQCVALSVYVGLDRVDARKDIPDEALVPLLRMYSPPSQPAAQRGDVEDGELQESTSNAAKSDVAIDSIASLSLAACVSRGFLVPDLMSYCPWKPDPSTSDVSSPVSSTFPQIMPRG